VSEQLLTVLKLCLLALLYLFFLRVLRVVWVETAYALADGLTLGRGTQCSIVLNDSFLSGTHARIVHLDGQWTLEDLGSTNGTFVNGAAIGGSVLLGIGDQIQLGGIVIEVR
jgi:predicted component of type VI protein secretion system